MTTKLSSASFEMDIRPGPKPQPTEHGLEGRFNIVVLGDFTGRASRNVVEPLAARKLLNIDTDNFARVFTQLGTKLKLTGTAISDGTIELPFNSLEDFHPDTLLTKVATLAKLNEARHMLLEPSTAEQGKAALQRYLGAAVSGTAAQSASTTPPTPESDNDTMARLLGGTPPTSKQSPAPASPVQQFIRQVVAPHVSPSPGAWQTGAIAAAEMELTNRLNAVLHHPDFQALEAAWRGVDMLVRRIESSEEIGLFVLDVSLSELQADLASHEQTERSVLFRLLRDRKPRLIVGNYTFGQNAADLRTLGQLAEIATRLPTPFVASAAAQLVGCDSFTRHPDPDDWKLKLTEDVAAIWETLRQSPAANHVGLAAPRFLLRQPYGKAGDPIENFSFEELPANAAHESFLWGHSAILCACVAIDAIQAGDTGLTEFTGGEISELPVHKFIEDGEVVVKPYAEAWLTDRAVARVLDRGIMPVVPVKNQNTIRLNHLRSIAGESMSVQFL